jgi:uncharacterized OB-fold protein
VTEPRYLPEGIPLPESEPLTAPFWEGCAQRELRIQRCTGCGLHRHVPSIVCSACGSFDYDWDVSQGRGRVFTYTIAHHSVHPSTRTAVPYNVSVIELDDCGGVFVTSNVVGCAIDDLQVGMPVRLVWEQVSPDLALYRFAPAGV